MSAMDKDSSGEVDFDEFYAWWNEYVASGLGGATLSQSVPRLTSRPVSLGHRKLLIVRLTGGHRGLRGGVAGEQVAVCREEAVVPWGRR